MRRTTDIYVRPLNEDLGKIANSIDDIIAHTKKPEGLTVTLRGMVQGMRVSFSSFALGLCLAVVLLYLILVAQFQSFIDPFIILIAVPPGIAGVILTLWLTDTTLNVMSLMGVVMLVGIAVSNSILIVEFTRHLRSEGMAVREAVAMACRVRLRPVLMTSLATIIGLLPMALKLGAGSEAYAPLARAILGGLSVSVALTVFLVPAAYVLVYGERGPGFGRSSCGGLSNHAALNALVCCFAFCGSPRFCGAASDAPHAGPGATTRDPEQSAIHAPPNTTPQPRIRCAPQYKAAYEPTVFGSFTGVGADNGSRLAAGGLNNPIVYNRIGSGPLDRADDHRFRPHEQPHRDGQTAGLRAGSGHRNHARADSAEHQPRLFRRCCARTQC